MGAGRLSFTPSRPVGIPQQVMRDRHELNSPCEFQTYPLRASWFLFVRETYGGQAVLDIAYSTVETTNVRIEQVLGDPIVEVDAAWEQWQRDRYAAIPNAAQLAAPYLQKFGNEPTCVEGEDW